MHRLLLAAVSSLALLTAGTALAQEASSNLDKLGSFKVTGASPKIPTIPQTGPQADAIKKMRSVQKEAKSGVTTWTAEELVLIKDWVPPTLSIAPRTRWPHGKSRDAHDPILLAQQVQRLGGLLGQADDAARAATHA